MNEGTPLLTKHAPKLTPCKQLIVENFAGALNIAFEDGGGWQLFFSLALRWGYPPSSFPCAALTGAGDMLGVFMSYLLFGLGKKYFVPTHTYKKAFMEATHYGLASFFSGMVWLLAEYQLIRWNTPFVPTALGTGFACGTTFLLFVQLLRLPLNHCCPNEIRGNNRESFADDLKVACGIFGGNAGFTATDGTNFDNPMVNVFETDNQHLTKASFKGGGTAALFAFATRLLTDVIIDRRYYSLAQSPHQ